MSRPSRTKTTWPSENFALVPPSKSITGRSPASSDPTKTPRGSVAPRVLPMAENRKWRPSGRKNGLTCWTSPLAVSSVVTGDSDPAASLTR